MPEIKKLWLVTDPSSDSSLRDILYETTPSKLVNYMRGSKLGDWDRENTKMYDSEAEATVDAKKRLAERSKSASHRIVARAAAHKVWDPERNKYVPMSPYEKTVGVPWGGRTTFRGPLYMSPEMEKFYTEPTRSEYAQSDAKRRELMMLLDIVSDPTKAQQYGLDAEEAEKRLRRKFHYTDHDIKQLGR